MSDCDQRGPSEPLSYPLSGCWDTSSDVACRAGQCFPYRTPNRALNNTQFCCCSGHLCNANISVVRSVIELTEDRDVTFVDTSGNSLKLKSFDTETESRDNGLLLACFGALVCLALIGSGLVICCRALSSSVIESNPKHKKMDSLHLLESNSSSSQSSSLLCEFEKLKLIEEIGRGRYGSVWKASLNEQTVAVKKFGQQYRHYFLNEKDIYLLPLMDMNRCLPRLLGFQELVSSEGRPEYHLVLSYAQMGSLQNYLRNKTIDWLTLCRMIQTTTQGLAYLHSEVKRGDARKPCVAHRDLSSRNILVNSDLTCMVCDFQFAIRISGSEYYSCGERYDSQTSSLNDVGTLRYMAPEILEGAVNLRDCESAMKQIDVYALGLVLWETASRCSDLYQGIEVPPYKQPFEHEIGLSPSFEQMQVLVNKNKARPLFPDIWKDSNPAIRSLKETIEDCWDHDAEARLTALCVEERLAELPLLWDRYKSGTLTSATNMYSLNTLANINNQINRLKSATNSYHNLIGSIDSSDKMSADFQTNRFINRLEYPNINSFNPIDNTVPYSPSSDFEKNLVSAANTFVAQPKVTLPLQPHQGRNPCLERNLMTESSDDKPSVFLEHGFKFQIKASNRDSLTADAFAENTNNESNSLMANDVLNRSANEAPRNLSRRPGHGMTSITIVQNAVGATPIPKRPNVTSNVCHASHGQSALKKTNETMSQINKESNLSKILRKVHLKSLKDWALKRRTANKESSFEEKEPFTQNNANNAVNVSPEERRTGTDSDCLISAIEGINVVETTLLEAELTGASTDPKVTHRDQRDYSDGSSMTTLIHKTNERISVDSHIIEVVVDKTVVEPSGRLTECGADPNRIRDFHFNTNKSNE